MRTFEKTHPWLTFGLNLRAADHLLWLDLGEAASKCEHLAGVPLRPRIAQHLHQIYLAKGVRGTTAIEGNTLSEEEVLAHIQGELNLPPSEAYLQQEVENIVAACNRIAAEIVGPDHNQPISVHLLREDNRQVRHKLKEPDGVSLPGEIRTESVIVGNVYRGAPAQDCEYLLGRLCDWLNGPDFRAPSERLTIPFAILKAIVAHLYMAWIHPFGDGNGRTARLLEYRLLLAAGLPLPAAHLMSDHYNRTRAEYYRQLDLASKSGGNPVPFIKYAVEGLVDGLREQIQLVRAQQWDVSWENYVHQEFEVQRSSETHKRRRDLVLALGHRADWVEIQQIVDLTPQLARAYAKKTDRTVQRDLNAVAEMGLIQRRHGKVRARREIILAFLPARDPEVE